MLHQIHKLDVPATGQAGASLDIRNLVDCVVRIDGADAGAFSIKVQCKIDAPPDEPSSNTWFDITGSILASTLVPLDRIASTGADLGGYSMPFTHIRIVSTTTGIPAPVAVIAGRADILLAT